MKPYYQDDYCTIYHGDCREILPSLPKVDLVLTDPPYGWKTKLYGDSSNTRSRLTKVHPTQKPVALMAWCISIAKNPPLILDPFMGSGTTLRAAKDLGRKAIGIEIEEKYCEIAAKRLAQGVLEFSA